MIRPRVKPGREKDALVAVSRAILVILGTTPATRGTIPVRWCIVSRRPHRFFLCLVSRAFVPPMELPTPRVLSTETTTGSNLPQPRIYDNIYIYTYTRDYRIIRGGTRVFKSIGYCRNSFSPGSHSFVQIYEKKLEDEAVSFTRRV